MADTSLKLKGFAILCCKIQRRIIRTGSSDSASYADQYKHCYPSIPEDGIARMTPRNIGIIGYGRLGRLLADILKEDFRLSCYDQRPDVIPRGDRCDLVAAASSDAIFICVPILQFDSAIATISAHVKPNSDVLDVCSVKTYPRDIMQRHFSPGHVLPTHPMFGPDAVADNRGFQGLPFVLCPTEQTRTELTVFWQEYFQQKGMRVLLMSCEEHDRTSAYSLCLTHLIARVLEPVLESSEIDSKNCKRLQEVIRACCNDPPELFEGLLTRNPFANEMRQCLRASLDKLDARLDSMIKG
jgi:prephenate dehydrogenase